MTQDPRSSPAQLATEEGGSAWQRSVRVLRGTLSGLGCLGSNGLRRALPLRPGSPRRPHCTLKSCSQLSPGLPPAIQLTRRRAVGCTQSLSQCLAASAERSSALQGPMATLRAQGTPAVATATAMRPMAPARAMEGTVTGTGATAMRPWG